MSKEKGEELFWALHSLLDVVTNLNLRDLEAEAKAASLPEKAKAESSTQGADTSASASAKEKAKDPDPDWTEVPHNPGPITPLSTRPRFQVVGSSSESPIVPPSQVSLQALSLANHPTYSPAVLAAWAAMNAPAGGGQNHNDGQGGPQGDGQEGPENPQGGGGNGNGNGGGGNESGQDGGGQAPLAYNKAAGFLAAWNTAPSDQAKDNLEQEAINCSPAQNVQFAAMMKINMQLQATVGQLTNRVAQA
jgi:hypothetical protein